MANTVIQKILCLTQYSAMVTPFANPALKIPHVQVTRFVAQDEKWAMDSTKTPQKH